MEAHLEDHLVTNRITACVKCAQEEFFKEIIQKPTCRAAEDQNFANSLVKVKVRRNTHSLRSDLLWRCILNSYSNYCKIHYSAPPSIKRPVLAQKTDNQQCKMDEIDDKIRTNKNLPIVSAYVRNISKLKLPNWSPTVNVWNIKEPRLKRIKSVIKTATKKENRSTRRYYRHANVRIASTVLKITPKILTSIPYVKLENVLAPPKKDEVVVKESFMNYFNLTNGNLARESPVIKAQKKICSKGLRYSSVPISSNLGRLLVSTNGQNQALVRIERTERYLSTVASSTSTVSTEYPITYDPKRHNFDLHTYKFPKRQQHHQRLSLKSYACSEVCSPVKVVLKRMNIDKYLKNDLFSNNNSKRKQRKP